MEIESKKTNRGFDYSQFEDSYGNKCSLQKSSSAMVDRIWFGVHDVNPLIMASDAIRLGLPTGGQQNGWVPFEVPKEVLFHDRMHLDQDEIHKLMPFLNTFEDTGELDSDYYNADFNWCNKEYLDKNGYELVDYTEMLKDFEGDVDRIYRTLTRMEERKKNIMTHLKSIKKAVISISDAFNEKAENEMKWYMKGYNDEKKGTSTIMDCTEHEDELYSMGADDAGCGDEPRTIKELVSFFS